MAKKSPRSYNGSGMKYLALVEALERDIAEGRYHPGDRLPPQRELAEHFGVTIATVTRAIAEAARRGMVVAKPGSGTYIREPSVVPEPKPTSGLIDLSVNTPTGAVVSDLLIELFEQTVRKRFRDDRFGYTPYLDGSDWRQVAADWIRCFGPDAPPDRIIPTHGVHQGLMAAFSAFAPPGDTVVCEPLAYTGVKRIADSRQVRLVGAESDEGGLVPEAVEAALRRSNASVLVVTTVTQNPTTVTLSAERCRAIADIARRLDVVVIEDAVNAPLAGEAMPAIAREAPERAIYLTGLSKCIAADFRLGYAVVPDSLLLAFHDALVTTHWIAPAWFAQLGTELLSGGLLAQCLDRHRTEAAERMRLVEEVLGPAMPYRLEYPSYHAWARVPNGWQADSFCTEALRAGVRVSPASHFGVIPPDDLPQAFRISLGACQSREELRSGLEKLASVMRRRPGMFGTVA